MHSPKGESIAEIAQLVERRLPKPKVAGSNPVFRSNLFITFARWQDEWIYAQVIRTKVVTSDREVYLPCLFKLRVPGSVDVSSPGYVLEAQYGGIALRLLLFIGGRCAMKEGEYVFYKKNKGDKVWWVDHVEYMGEFLVSFDKKKIFNLWLDYPWNFSKEEKELFDKENPYWRDFFALREAQRHPEESDK